MALLNVMEERDIQVRGYTLRLPLDVLLVASANPEDYTNRGRIITPLKDRFGAEIRTHYPLELDDEVAVIAQEADLVAAGARLPAARSSPGSPGCCASPAPIDQGSGVSARFAIAAAETVAAAALHRAAIAGEARPGGPADRPGVGADVLRGKLEFASGEEGREDGGARAPAAPGHRGHRPRPAARASTSTPLAEAVDAGARCAPGSGCRPPRWWRRCRASPVLTEVGQRLGAAGTEDPGRWPSAAELALELLFLTRKLDQGRRRRRDR